MKTKLVKSIMAPLVVACALLTMVAATASGQGTQGGTLQGTWEMQITLTDCAGHVIRSFPSLIEYAAGGTVVESNGGTPQALKTPGEGVRLEAIPAPKKSSPPRAKRVAHCLPWSAVDRGRRRG